MESKDKENLKTLLDDLNKKFIESTDFQKLAHDALVKAYKERINEYYSDYNSTGRAQIKKIVEYLFEIPEDSLRKISPLGVIDTQMEIIKGFISQFGEQAQTKLKKELEQISGIISKKEFTLQEIVDEYIELVKDQSGEYSGEVSVYLNKSEYSDDTHILKLCEDSDSNYVSDYDYNIFIDKDKTIFSYLVGNKAPNILKQLTSTKTSFEGWLFSLKINRAKITDLFETPIEELMVSWGDD